MPNGCFVPNVGLHHNSLITSSIFFSSLNERTSAPTMGAQSPSVKMVRTKGSALPSHLTQLPIWITGSVWNSGKMPVNQRKRNVIKEEIQLAICSAEKLYANIATQNIQAGTNKSILMQCEEGDSPFLLAHSMSNESILNGASLLHSPSGGWAMNLSQATSTSNWHLPVNKKQTLDINILKLQRFLLLAPSNSDRQ